MRVVEGLSHPVVCKSTACSSKDKMPVSYTMKRWEKHWRNERIYYAFDNNRDKRTRRDTERTMLSMDDRNIYLHDNICCTVLSTFRQEWHIFLKAWRWIIGYCIIYHQLLGGRKNVVELKAKAAEGIRDEGCEQGSQVSVAHKSIAVFHAAIAIDFNKRSRVVRLRPVT